MDRVSLAGYIQSVHGVTRVRHNLVTEPPPPPPAPAERGASGVLCEQEFRAGAGGVGCCGPGKPPSQLPDSLHPSGSFPTVCGPVD